jgi:hypothetical protein
MMWIGQTGGDLRIGVFAKRGRAVLKLARICDGASPRRGLATLRKAWHTKLVGMRRLKG